MAEYNQRYNTAFQNIFRLRSVEAGTVLIDHIEFLGEGEESNQIQHQKFQRN